jgi:hypothetical protein
MPSYYLTCGQFIVASQAQAGNQGVDTKIKFIDFIPDPDGVVALIQAVKCTSGDSLANLTEDYPSGGGGDRVEDIWTDDHWAIDAPGAAVRRPYRLEAVERRAELGRPGRRWTARTGQ